MLTFNEYIIEIGGENNLPAELDMIEPWENQSFKDRFINRFKYREIGMKVQDENGAIVKSMLDKYSHYLEMTLQECVSLYALKISKQIANINTLYERTLKEDSKDTVYFNPITATDVNKLKVANVGKSEKSKSFNWLASNAKVMEEVNKLTIMFEEALKYCEIIFYGLA